MVNTRYCFIRKNKLTISSQRSARFITIFNNIVTTNTISRYDDKISRPSCLCNKYNINVYMSTYIFKNERGIRRRIIATCICYTNYYTTLKAVRSNRVHKNLLFSTVLERFF